MIIYCPRIVYHFRVFHMQYTLKPREKKFVYRVNFGWENGFKFDCDVTISVGFLITLKHAVCVFEEKSEILLYTLSNIAVNIMNLIVLRFWFKRTLFCDGLFFFVYKNGWFRRLRKFSFTKGNYPDRQHLAI